MVYAKSVHFPLSFILLWAIQRSLAKKTVFFCSNSNWSDIKLSKYLEQKNKSAPSCLSQHISQKLTFNMSIGVSVCKFKFCLFHWQKKNYINKWQMNVVQKKFVQKKKKKYFVLRILNCMYITFYDVLIHKKQKNRRLFCVFYLNYKINSNYLYELRSHQAYYVCITYICVYRKKSLKKNICERNIIENYYKFLIRHFHLLSSSM